MLVAAAVCPHPPLLVPTVAAGAASELAALRDRCTDALATVTAASPTVIYVVGIDSSPRATSFAPWGAPVDVDVPEPLPLSLLVGAWLTRGTVRSFVAVDADLDADECASLGRELAESSDRVAFVVMGDGSARHSEKAPGYLDARAAPYDDRVAAAFGGADVDALLALDPQLSRDLLVAGRAPWQVLAGAADGRAWSAVASVEMPYGVAYHVASWT